MKNLFDLLGRFSRSLNKDQITKEVVKEVVRSRTYVNLDTDLINLKDGILEISTSSVAKNEINLKEEGIKQELRAKGVPVIRILYK